MHTYWWMYLGNTSATPILVNKIEICKPAAGALTLRIAIMAVDDGTQGTSNTFLAYDVCTKNN